jgi:type IV pilus assembly protein PilC
MVQTAATVGVQPKAAGRGFRAFLSYSPGKVNPQEIILFCRQLASFVRVGVPVTTAIRTFAEQAKNGRVREAYTAVANDVEQGMKLSDAFAAHPKVFPEIITDMVRSAEVTGNLDSVLRQAAAHIDRETSARRKIKSAMAYPIIIVTVALVVSVGIITFVLPSFTDLYKGLGVPLPGILVAVLGFRGYIALHGIPIAIGFLIAFLLFGYSLRTVRGRYLVDVVLLRIPVMSALSRAAMTERFCRTLGDMLAAGVPITQTYAVVIRTVRNRVYRRALQGVAPAMAAGHGLYRPLEAAKIFTPAVIQMFRVGEETGHLDTNLTEAADMYGDELDYRIKRMTSVLEPALIVFVGLIVGFIAVTLVTSIYSLAGSFK